MRRLSFARVVFERCMARANSSLSREQFGSILTFDVQWRVASALHFPGGLLPSLRLWRGCEPLTSVHLAYIYKATPINASFPTGHHPNSSSPPHTATATRTRHHSHNLHITYRHSLSLPLDAPLSTAAASSSSSSSSCKLEFVAASL